jgi:hypothetical protein
MDADDARGRRTHLRPSARGGYNASRRGERSYTIWVDGGSAARQKHDLADVAGSAPAKLSAAARRLGARFVRRSRRAGPRCPSCARPTASVQPLAVAFIDSELPRADALLRLDASPRQSDRDSLAPPAPFALEAGGEERTPLVPAR